MPQATSCAAPRWWCGRSATAAMPPTASMRALTRRISAGDHARRWQPRTVGRDTMLRLYDFLDSGNGYKVRLTLAQTGVPYELVELDILKGETRTPDFLVRNPNGRIP